MSNDFISGVLVGLIIGVFLSMVLVIWIELRLIQEIDAKIVKLKAEGRTKDIEKLERFKRVFLLEEKNSNFEWYDKDKGIPKYKEKGR